MYLHWTILARLVLPLALSECTLSTQCSDYLHASIAEMRQSTGSGCFELEHVVVIARTPSQVIPRVYVQDPKGGPFSAIRAKCDASPTHACPSETTRAVESLVDGSQVTVRGYYFQGSASGFEEIYLDAVQDEQRLLAAPARAQLSVAQVTRSARSRAEWFQIVDIDVASEDPLVMYDFSPSEFAHGATCPKFSGFGVIAQSAAPALGAPDCIDRTNPPGAVRPDDREVLIGREFFKEFFASTDCGCALDSKQHLLLPSSQVSGPIRGVLSPEMKAGASLINQVLHPLSRASFPITGG